MLSAVWLSSPASARMLDLGLTPSGIMSQGTAVSGDGQVVVGPAQDSTNQYQLFRWTERGGMTVLITDPGLMEVATLSRDGGVMVGSITVGDELMAFRWDAHGGMQHLGRLGGISSRGYGVSADGSVVVGGFNDGVTGFRAFRWTAAQGMHELDGLTASGASTAYGISGDGTKVVGSSRGNAGTRAVLWQNGSIEDLGVLPGDRLSEAYAISADGQVVVGTSGTSGFRWTSTSGMQNLGSLGGSVTTAAATNADGSVVVGSSTSVDEALRGFRWAADTGMVDLGVLHGGTYSTAYGVSDDGSVIVGEGDNGLGTRAIVWSTRPSVQSGPQDLDHLQASVLASADTLARLHNSQARLTANVAAQHCLPGATQHYCLAVRGDAEFAGAGDDSRLYQGMLLAGRRLNEQFAVGINTLLARNALHARNAEPSTGYGAALWLAYEQEAATGLGWKASASVAGSRADARFERGERIADVQAASTRVRLTAQHRRLALGYGLAAGDTLLTPELALDHGSTRHPAFTERNVALPLRVLSARSDATYASLALHSATPLNSRRTLHLRLGADVLLKDDQPALAGSSAIPGLNRFALDSRLQRRDWAPSLALQLSHAVSPQTTVAAGAQVAASRYEQDRPMVGVGAQLSYRF